MSESDYYSYLRQIHELYGDEIFVTFPETMQTYSLSDFENEINACEKCSLGKTRTKFVFGGGNPQSPIVFVGEAPGKDEDLQGEPFVGRAGKLLDKIFAAINLSREDVYICNVLKCRPPQNRDPLPSEIELCEPYLLRQLEIIQPGLIVALGRIAAHTLLKIKDRMMDMRKQTYIYHGIPMKVTYHPSALLRNPSFKKPAWEDFKEILAVYNQILSERSTNG